MFDHMRTGAFLLWAFMASFGGAAFLGAAFEYQRTQSTKRRQAVKAAAKAAERATWDAFWASVPREDRDLEALAAEWTRLYGEGGNSTMVVTF